MSAAFPRQVTQHQIFPLQAWSDWNFTLGGPDYCCWVKRRRDAVCTFYDGPECFITGTFIFSHVCIFPLSLLAVAAAFVRYWFIISDSCDIHSYYSPIRTSHCWRWSQRRITHTKWFLVLISMATAVFFPIQLFFLEIIPISWNADFWGETITK